MSAREIVDWIKENKPWPGPVDLSEALFGPLMSCAPQELRTLYEREAFLAVTSAQQYPSARIQPVAPTEWVIEVTGGLISILYATARSVALLIPEPDSEDDGWGNLSEGASRIAEVLWWYRVMRAGKPLRFPEDQRRNAIAETLLQGSLLFFIGHECGHLILDLRGEQEFAKKPDYWPTRNLQHRTEFLADELGLGLIMELCPLKAGAIEEQRYYGAAELGLHTWELMENVGFCFARSHPPTKDRVELLRRVALGIATARHIRRNPKSNFSIPSIGRLAATIGNIMRRLSDEILGGGGTTVFREGLVDQLDEFLELNHTIPVSDYPRVYALIFAVKDFADLPDLLWAAGRLAARRADILAEVDELGQVLTDDEIMVELSKQNLLLKCVDLLVPPRGSVDFLPLLREALSGASRKER